MSSVSTSKNGTGGSADCPPVLTFTSSSLEARTRDLRKHFLATFNEEPSFYVRVPGRVNLIGEHIDYCGYSVCPMAIQQDVVAAVKPTNNQTLRLTNLEKKYSDFQCDLNTMSIVKNGVPEWHNYFLCGVKGVLEILPEEGTPVGMMVAISGNIPPNAGLSSSSALVSAAALTTSHANKVSLTKQDIATLAAKSEHFIGTEGGGMDQAIAFLGIKGSAKHIRFNPLRSENLTLPTDAVFVIAHSLAELNKASTSQFNCRVAECRLASQILAKVSGLSTWETLTRLADLQSALGLDLDEMVSLVTSVLHEEPYTKEEICSKLEISEEKLMQISLSNKTAHLNQFKLKQRALHVFQEASRVSKFREECTRACDASTLHRLGDLMRKSHLSLQQLYECSHPALDQIVAVGDAHTFGARLTGAGWGGCVVALTSRDSAPKYIELLKQKFYNDHPATELKDVDTLVFATEPYEGAQIFAV